MSVEMRDLCAVYDPFPSIDSIERRLTEKTSDSLKKQDAGVEKTARVKTRFINFRKADVEAERTMARTSVQTPDAREQWAPFARLEIVSGPGKGKSFTITSGSVNLGRDSDQDIQIDFGDTSISRQCHASISYYGKSGGYLIRDGMKPNPVYLNEKTIVGEKRLQNRDLIKIGGTTLEFIAGACE